MNIARKISKISGPPEKTGLVPEVPPGPPSQRSWLHHWLAPWRAHSVKAGCWGN